MAATRSERREEAAAAVGELRGAARAAGTLAVASAASATATRAASPDVVTTSSSQMKSPPRLTKGGGEGNSAVGLIGMDLADVLEPGVKTRQLPYSSSTEMSVSVKKGTHLTLGMTTVLKENTFSEHTRKLPNLARGEN